jgi:hypothetical protein
VQRRQRFQGEAAATARAFSSSSTRTSQQGLARELKGGNGLFASDGRKLPEKLVECVAALDVVEQRLYRDAGTNKDGRSAQNLWVAVHDSSFVGHVWARSEAERLSRVRRKRQEVRLKPDTTGTRKRPSR